MALGVFTDSLADRIEYREAVAWVLTVDEWDDDRIIPAVRAREVHVAMNADLSPA